MAISLGIEFFTQDDPADTSPGIGEVLTMFTNSSGVLGIGSVTTITADVSELLLLRGPQIEAGTLNEDRLANISFYGFNLVTGIDLTTTGTTAIYTTPSSQTALILGVILEVTAADTVTAAPEVSIGVNPSTNNVFASETLFNLNAVGELYFYWANTHKAIIVSSGDQLDLNVAVAATATTLTVSARTIGVLLD